MNCSEDFKKDAKNKKCHCLYRAPTKTPKREEEFSKRIKNLSAPEIVRIINGMDLNTGKPRGGPN